MLSDAQIRAVARTLAEGVVPPDVELLIFGSRSHGNLLKQYSDLDICLRGRKCVPSEMIQRLKEAYDESNLPVKVDVVDWHALSAEFQNAIARDLKPL